MTPGDVFLVDDNPENLTLLATLLRGAGHVVRIANNGRRALSILETHPAELLLLDVAMPGMDGFAVCRALKEREATRGIPVLFISALDAPVDKVAAFRAGAVDYVTKPFEPAEVLARVDTHLRLVRLQKEAEARAAELERANAQLRESSDALLVAQDELARLARAEVLGGEPSLWAGSVAAGIARALGARGVSVWVLEAGGLRLLAGQASDPEPPPLGGWRSDERRSVQPIHGASGELRGALVAEGLGTFPSEVRRRVLESAATHLGTALDLHDLGLRLARAREATGEQDEEARAGICPSCGRCEPVSEGANVCPADGSALDSYPDLPHRIAGRYRLVRLLGRGGMGMVLSARDERLDRDVALKRIAPSAIADGETRRRLEREARTIARLSHPSVVAVHDFVEARDGGAVLVMELLDGVDLGRLLARSGAGRTDQVATVLRCAGSAIAAGHAAGIVHRDIKPANIVLSGGPSGLRVKVVDFGLARPLERNGVKSGTDLVAGTPAYMSPEQVVGGEVGPPSDLYSLAVVAWEALAGGPLIDPWRPPFRVMMDVLSVVPELPSRLRPELPDAVDTLLLDGLARRAGDRPKDIEAWAGMLADALDRVPPASGTVHGWPNAPVGGRPPERTSASSQPEPSRFPLRSPVTQWPNPTTTSPSFPMCRRSSSPRAAISSLRSG